MEWTQETRPIAVATPLGDDVLVLRSMSGTEQIGRMFDFRLDMLSENHEIAMDDVLGQNATVSLRVSEDVTRYFNGFVSQFSQVGVHGRMAAYQASLRPWLWFLTRTADCRIFQEMTVPDIIDKVFRDHGFTDFEAKLSGTYRKWVYCVQYRETDFNFLSRLMEQEGIYYYFNHENGKHTLILADAYSSHSKIEGYEQVPFYPPTDTAPRERDHLHGWTIVKQVQPGAYALNDFDFEKPKASLAVRSAVSREHAANHFEVYDSPGEYVETSDGEAYARARIEELQAAHEVLNGVGNARGLTSGGLFELTQYPREDQNREYLVVSASHDLHSSEFDSGGGGGSGETYSGAITAIDAKTPYRPPRLTPKPVVQGPQTAVIVGKSGEEIWTDKYGRVKVKFHWDRESKGDESSSCWIRVAQTIAGKGWGAIHLPRIGQEVIVEFLEGDPDRPLITGRVYNAVNRVPYGLPADQTISGLKSSSSKGGGGFNEIRMEDKKGEEQLFLHAEKNYDLRVKNDRFETIGHDRNLVVENDKKEHVKNERHAKVDSHHYEEVGADRHLKVAGKQAVEVKKSLSLTVDDDVLEVFKKNHSEQVTNDYYLKGDNVVIEATTNITVKVGQSFIAIEAGGIKIGTTGQLVLESTGAASMKGTAGLTLESPATTDVKGTSTTVKGDAMCTIQGGLVKIN